MALNVILPFKKLRSLTSINLFVLAVRLVQFFFAGMEVGLMAFYIQQEVASGEKASSPYVYLLVASIITLFTQFIYCFEFYHEFIWLWDLLVGAGFMLSFFWMLNFVSPLPCSWGSFNPFGSDHCGQTRAILVIQIVLAVLWFFTAVLGAVNLFLRRRKAAFVEGDV